MPKSFDAIAEKLAEHEIALSEMYAQFARTFTVDAELWTSMSREEATHAMWIDAARQSAGALSAEMPDIGARQQAVEVATSYARSLTERCRAGKMTRRQAYALARDVENGMLERKLFDILTKVSPELSRLRDALTQQTADHRDKIAKAMGRLPERSS